VWPETLKSDPIGYGHTPPQFPPPRQYTGEIFYQQPALSQAYALACAQPSTLCDQQRQVQVQAELSARPPTLPWVNMGGGGLGVGGRLLPSWNSLDGTAHAGGTDQSRRDSTSLMPLDVLRLALQQLELQQQND
jgi:hypothetical protein